MDLSKEEIKQNIAHCEKQFLYELTAYRQAMVVGSRQASERALTDAAHFASILTALKQILADDFPKE